MMMLLRSDMIAFVVSIVGRSYIVALLYQSFQQSMNTKAIVFAIEPETGDSRALIPIEQEWLLLLQFDVLRYRLDERICIQPVVDENAIVGLSNTRIHEEGA